MTALYLLLSNCTTILAALALASSVNSKSISLSKSINLHLMAWAGILNQDLFSRCNLPKKKKIKSYLRHSYNLLSRDRYWYRGFNSRIDSGGGRIAVIDIQNRYGIFFGTVSDYLYSIPHVVLEFRTAYSPWNSAQNSKLQSFYSSAHWCVVSRT